MPKVGHAGMGSAEPPPPVVSEPEIPSRGSKLIRSYEML
jgi:hypothetical protein